MLWAHNVIVPVSRSNGFTFSWLSERLFTLQLSLQLHLSILSLVCLHTLFFFFLWKSLALSSINCLVTHILQNIYFCVQKKRKTWWFWTNEWSVNYIIFIFWVNCSFNWSKVNTVDVHFYKRFLFQINSLLLDFLFIKESRNYYCLLSTILLIEMFLEQQISIRVTLEWFLKYHVTLKTGVMMLKHSVLINY